MVENMYGSIITGKVPDFGNHELIFPVEKRKCDKRLRELFWWALIPETQGWKEGSLD